MEPECEGLVCDDDDVDKMEAYSELAGLEREESIPVPQVRRCVL